MSYQFDLQSVIVGAIVGALVGLVCTVAFSQPRIARAIGKMVAVVLLGIGAGLLTWGLLSIFQVSTFEVLEFGPVTLYSPAQTIGWGAGALAAGVAALVLSLTSG